MHAEHIVSVARAVQGHVYGRADEFSVYSEHSEHPEHPERSEYSDFSKFSGHSEHSECSENFEYSEYSEERLLLTQGIRTSSRRMCGRTPHRLVASAVESARSLWRQSLVPSVSSSFFLPAPLVRRSFYRQAVVQAMHLAGQSVNGQAAHVVRSWLSVVTDGESVCQSVCR